MVYGIMLTDSRYHCAFQLVIKMEIVTVVGASGNALKLYGVTDLKMSETMVVREATLNKIIYSLAVFILLPSCVLVSGCKDKESYKKEMARKGIAYSADSFLNEVGAGNKERIELFIKAGMDINAKGNNGYTALMVALMNDNPEIVKVLLEKGADVNARSNAGYTALMFVSSKGNMGATKVLIKKGADVNAKNSDGETPLMLASLRGNVDVAKLLIANGADVNAKSNKGDTALKYAYLDKQIEELLRKAGAKE